jgi:ArsR family transcriptional regulator, arsenate/arsenite/antimonite-responsive transcriptional repressor
LKTELLFYIIKNMETEAAINALGALAQETRLAVFRLLVQAGPEGRAAGVIAELLRVPLATLSFHLQQLNQARLVRAQRRGTSIIYAANYTTMNELMRYLTEHCCEGRPEICYEVEARSEAQTLPLTSEDCCERSQVK